MLAQDLEKQQGVEFRYYIVNHASTDGTAEWLSDWEQKHERCIALYAEEYSSISSLRGKKYAMSIGIKSIKSGRILCLDADCRLFSSLGLASILQQWASADIWIGYAPYIVSNPLSHLVAVEAYFFFLQSYILWRLNYSVSATGRNWGFVMKTYDVQMLESHAPLLSGDDDLSFHYLVNNGATVAMGYRPESVIYSYPPTRVTAWFLQKARHVSTGMRYPKKTLLAMFFWNIAHLLPFVFLAFGVVDKSMFYGTASIILFLCLGIFHSIWRRKLRLPTPLPFILLALPIIFAFRAIAWCYSQIKPRNNW